jgi:hypothetical protein
LYILNLFVLKVNDDEFKEFTKSFTSKIQRFYNMNHTIYNRYTSFVEKYTKDDITFEYNEVFEFEEPKAIVEESEEKEAIVEESEEKEAIVEESDEEVEPEVIVEETETEPIVEEPEEPETIVEFSTNSDNEDDYNSTFYNSLMNNSNNEIDYTRIENFISTEMNQLYTNILQQLRETSTTRDEDNKVSQKLNILEMENQELQRENEEIFQRLTECEKQFNLIKDKYKSLQQIKRKYKTMVMNGANINHIENIKDNNTISSSRKTFISPIPNEHYRHPYQRR